MSEALASRSCIHPFCFTSPRDIQIYRFKRVLVLSSILLKEPLGPKMTLDSAKSQINEIVCRENKLTGHSTAIPHGTNAFERFNVFENANAR